MCDAKRNGLLKNEELLKTNELVPGKAFNLKILLQMTPIIITYNIPMHRFYPKIFLRALLTKLLYTLSAMHENKIFRI
jgi:hypothetical protein